MCMIGDWVTVGGLTGIHQFVKIGAHAMIGFASAVSQDVPPYMLVDGNPLAVRGFNVGGPPPPRLHARALAAVKQMHRLLYRQGKTLDEARAAIAALASETPEAAERCRADERLPRRRDARHRALRAWRQARQFALVAGEASGDLLAGLMLDGLQARWPGLQSAGIGGPQMLARGFESWWPQEKLAVRGYVEVLRHYRGDRRHPPPAQGALAGRAARHLHRRRRAGLQPRPRGRLRGQGIKTVAFRLPLDLGLAARARREDPRRGRPCAVHLPVRAGAAGGARASPPATWAIRWPT